MPHKKNQTKRAAKSKSNKSRKGLSKYLFSMLNVNNKYININSNILQLSVICILSIFIAIQLQTILSSSLINNSINNIINIGTDTSYNTNNHNHVKTSDGHPFCRIQSTENKGYIAFEGCRVVSNSQSDKINTNNIMSNEEKDINEIMAQLHSNAHATFGSNVDQILINSVKIKDKRKKKSNKKKKAKTNKITVSVTDVQPDAPRPSDENSWQPRRERDTIVTDNSGQHPESDHDLETNDTDIDVNLMGMYRRGYKFEFQLNKMHYQSDSVYEQIMEDISTNGISQADIYRKYHINFIPNETQFKLVPPKQNNSYYIKYYNTMRYSNIGVINNYNKEIKREAFTNFYALTRMQQKYKRNDGMIDIEDRDIEYDMDMLRHMLGHSPNDILNVILNDDKLPQWLYESDIILDVNCGIADSLIYLLNNFTTIKGICVVGTSRIKYKYAYLNIKQNGLLDRIDIIQQDLYSPFVKALYNISDVIYMDFSHMADDEYLTYFTTDIMNDHSIRQTKPGRVMLSYNRLLFDPNVLQASYTLHFAGGSDKVSLYMYSMPFFVSELSNLYVQNYQVFYGYDTYPIFNKQKEYVMTSPYLHELDDKIIEKISSAVGTSENDKVNKIWKTISSQLLYKSFMNSIQKLINKAADKHQIHLEINQRLLDILALVNKNRKSIPVEDEWEFVEYLIINSERIKDKCLVYKHVFKEWKSQVKYLLNENAQLTFYDLIKDYAQTKMKSLVTNCNK